MEKWTEEVRLTSAAGGRFEWLAGFFYTHEDALNDQIVFSFDMDGHVIAPLNPLATVQLPSNYEEYAGLGNETWRVPARFWVTGRLPIRRTCWRERGGQDVAVPVGA